MVLLEHCQPFLLPLVGCHRRSPYEKAFQDALLDQLVDVAACEVLAIRMLGATALHEPGWGPVTVL